MSLVLREAKTGAGYDHLEVRIEFNEKIIYLGYIKEEDRTLGELMEFVAKAVVKKVREDNKDMEGWRVEKYISELHNRLRSDMISVLASVEVSVPGNNGSEEPCAMYVSEEHYEIIQEMAAGWLEEKRVRDDMKDEAERNIEKKARLARMRAKDYNDGNVDGMGLGGVKNVDGMVKVYYHLNRSGKVEKIYLGMAYRGDEENQMKMIAKSIVKKAREDIGEYELTGSRLIRPPRSLDDVAKDLKGDVVMVMSGYGEHLLDTSYRIGRGLTGV